MRSERHKNIENENNTSEKKVNFQTKLANTNPVKQAYRMFRVGRPETKNIRTFTPPA